MSHGVEHEVSFLILICVLSLFFFPAAEGPYPAVHGPVTALQAMRFSVRLQNAIAAVLSCVSPTPIAAGAGSFSSMAVRQANLAGRDPGATTTILRC